MRSATRWLVLGSIAGLALAAGSLLTSGDSEPVSSAIGASGDAVALVNGQPITSDAMARFAATLARERGRLGLDPVQKRQMLDRLIDEELLLQRGIDLGLARSEPGVRRAIVTAVIDTLTTDDSREPTRDDLEALLRESPQGFARRGRVTIEAARVPLAFPSAEEAPRRAAEVARRAQIGESLGVIGAEIAQPIEPPLPAGPISIDALRDRVGGIVVDAILALTPGETSAPIRAMDGYWVVHLFAKEADVTPSVDEIAGPLRDEWIRRDHDRRLDEELTRMREGARIEIVDPELRPPGS